jgi:hypothetical protein
MVGLYLLEPLRNAGQCDNLDNSNLQGSHPLTSLLLSAVILPLISNQDHALGASSREQDHHWMIHKVLLAHLR